MYGVCIHLSEPSLSITLKLCQLPSSRFIKTVEVSKDVKFLQFSGMGRKLTNAHVGKEWCLSVLSRYQIIHTGGNYERPKYRKMLKEVCSLADLSESISKPFSLSCGFSRILFNSTCLISLSFSLFRLSGNASKDAVLTTSVSSLSQWL